MITTLPTERVNFWTHFAGFLAWIPVTAFLVGRAASGPTTRWDLVAVTLVYGLGTMFLFFCSAWYHRNKKAENERSVWRTLDHFAIFVMIAASYTPVVWIWFAEPWKTWTLVFQWTVTLVGLGFKILAPKAPRWISPLLYVLMGWVAMAAVVPLFQRMSLDAFLSLLGGGFWYTAGAVIYALKKPVLKPGFFGFHELFHCFILAGAASHAVLIGQSLVAATRP